MPIDFVMPWVDGEDPLWLAEKARVTGKAPKPTAMDMGEFRYRDWNILKYWFRAVEENAPWVRTIHFVTSGQRPDFLNLEHPKLHFVTHPDYLPKQYLPTFSSRTIDLNFHRIEGLSEQFVYFNDDMYLNRPVQKTDFFRDGKPCLTYLERPLRTACPPTLYDYTLLNDIALINAHFTRRDLLRSGIGKVLNVKYGKKGLSNLLFLPLNRFLHFDDPHLPVPVLKSTMEEVWRVAPEILDTASAHKERAMTDVNQYVFRYWELARGNFYPVKPQGKMYNVEARNVDACADDIRHGRQKLLCVNDSQRCDDFAAIQQKLVDAFEARYPKKSSFEK